MEWSLEYYSEDVEESILSLPDGLLARYLRLTDLMIEFGPNLGLPHTKAIKGGLFELRVKSKKGIARVFLLYYFKKQDLYAPYFYKKITKNSKKGIENCVFTIERGKKS
jgi:phage-related protein